MMAIIGFAALILVGLFVMLVGLRISAAVLASCFAQLSAALCVELAVCIAFTSIGGCLIYLACKYAPFAINFTAAS